MRRLGPAGCSDEVITERRGHDDVKHAHQSSGRQVGRHQCAAADGNAVPFDCRAQHQVAVAVACFVLASVKVDAGAFCPGVPFALAIVTQDAIALQSGRCFRQSALVECGTAHREQPFLHQLFRFTSFPITASITDRNIGLTAFQVCQCGRAVNMNDDIRLLFLEACNARQQPAVGKGLQRGDSDGRGALQRRNFIHRAADLAQRRLDAAQQQGAFPRQQHLPALPLEQRHAERRFQAAYLLADGTVRHMQLLRRARIAEQPRGGFEGMQRMKGSLSHGLIVSFSNRRCQ